MVTSCIYNPKRCWHCWIVHLLEKYQNNATLEQRSAYASSETWWSFWCMVDFSGKMDWDLSWRLDYCQKGSIVPAEFCPAQTSSSKHLERTKSGMWVGDTKPQHVICIIYTALLNTSTLISRLFFWLCSQMVSIEHFLSLLLSWLF